MSGGQASPDGWEVVSDSKASAPPPDGWTVFRQSDQTPNEQLPWYSDPSSSAYGKLFDAVINHLPVIAGATGGLLGAAFGPPGAIGGATLGGAAGEAYKQLIQSARGQSSPDGPIDAGTAIAKEAALQGGAQAVGEGAAPVLAGAGERVMQSAVKPAAKYLKESLTTGETPKVIKTLLDEGINVTRAGVAKLQSLIGATNDEIKDAIAGSQARIPALKVASRLNDTAKILTNQVNPQADLEALSNVGENFLQHPAIDAAGTLSVPDAQALKQGTYKQIAKSYGTKGNAAIESEKSLARGLKEEIANEVPNVDALNQRESGLLQALDVVGKRLALSGNHDPIGLAWATHNPSTFLAAVLSRSAGAKSLLARGLYESAGKTAQVAPQLIRGAVEALATSDDPAHLSATSPVQ